jgi:hypothetical protein
MGLIILALAFAASRILQADIVEIQTKEYKLKNTNYKIQIIS